MMLICKYITLTSQPPCFLILNRLVFEESILVGYLSMPINGESLGAHLPQ